MFVVLCFLFLFQANCISDRIPNRCLFAGFSYKWLSLMIWTKMGLKIMVLEQHYCGHFNFCRSNAVSPQLTGCSVPSQQPPPVLRSAPPGAALPRREHWRGTVNFFFWSGLDNIIQHFALGSLFAGPNLAMFRQYGLPEVFSQKKDVFEQNSKNHSSHLTCKRTQTTRTCSILSGGTSNCCPLLSCRMIWQFMGIVKSIQLLSEIELHKKDWSTRTTVMKMIVWCCWWFFCVFCVRNRKTLVQLFSSELFFKLTLKRDSTFVSKVFPPRC